MSDPPERRMGEVIAGKWRVDSLLGSGSMAAVYAVTHRNGARAALKILHPTLCTDEGVCERFLGEGYLTNAVKHPGIVRVLDDGMTDDGCVFLVMDLLEGRTLEALRQERGGRIGLAEVLDVADELMDALCAVHEAGIIHRDLKPQNVFVCGDGAVKLLDFGVARVFEGGPSELSAIGLVLGTPSFMSPEQALGARDRVDHRSDIWSLGATLFTAMTGQTVHLGPHVQAKLLAAATLKARSIAMVRPDLPAPIAAAIDTALRFEKEERWQSVNAFRRALGEARRAVELDLDSPESSPPPSWLDPSDVDVSPSDANQRSAPVVARASGRPPPLPSRARTSASRPGGAGDGSYPAVGSTLPPHEGAPRMGESVRRRTGAGVWIAGCLLGVVAASGVAFLSVDRSAAGEPDRASTAPAAPATTTPAAPAPLPAEDAPVTAPSSRTIPAARLPAARPRAAPAPPRSSSYSSMTNATKDARPPATEDRAPAEPASPDLFGTPE